MTAWELAGLATVLVLTVSTPAAFWLIRRERRSPRLCPDCDVELATVAAAGAGPNRHYEVAACLRCSTTAALVDGRRVDVARCPACGEEALSLVTVRVEAMPARVGVREACGKCRHDRSYTVAAGDATPVGKVIVFPGPGERPPRRGERRG